MKCIFLFALSLLASAASHAWHGGGHGGGWYGGHGHYHGYRGDYGWGGGGFFYGGGWGPGPNIVINVPPEGYYVPECENVEVCNRYGRCWIERHCD